MLDQSLNCRYCGDPLPPRVPGRRGRPGVTHAGTCRRLYTNRFNLAYRVKRFKDAHLLTADRSDAGRLIVQTYDFDEIEDGYSDMDVDPYRGVWGPQMMHLVEEWETRERLRKRIVALLDKVAYESFEAMTDDEQTAVIHMAVANRRSRRRD